MGSQKFTWFLTVTRTSPSSMKYIQSASSPCDSTEDRSNIKLIILNHQTQRGNYMSDSTKKQHASVLWWMFLLQNTSVFLYTKYHECLKLENQSAIEIIYCNYGNVLVDLVVSLLRLLYRCKFLMISWKDPHFDICVLYPRILHTCLMITSPSSKDLVTRASATFILSYSWTKKKKIMIDEIF